MAAADTSHCKEEFQRTVNVWVTQSKSLRILIFGKTGTGKSSLINTLFSEEVAKEGHSIRSETVAVECYTKTISVVVNDVRVTLWDTPGLKDPNTDCKRTIREIEEKCLTDVDLFVYCTRFDQSRLGQDDVDCIRNITRAFGGAIWKRALFALTFANKTSVPPSSQATLEEFFKSRESQWRDALLGIVKDNVKPDEMPIGKIESIPVIPTGYRDQRLPGDKPWFTDFWVACLLRVNFFSIPALIRASSDRVKSEAERAIAGRVVGQRCAELGDNMDTSRGEMSELESAIVGRVIGQRVATRGGRINSALLEDNKEEEGQLVEGVDSSQMMHYLVTAIREDQESLRTRFFRWAGNTWTDYGTYALFAAAGVGIAAKLSNLI